MSLPMATRRYKGSIREPLEVSHVCVTVTYHLLTVATGGRGQWNHPRKFASRLRTYTYVVESLQKFTRWSNANEYLLDK